MGEGEGEMNLRVKIIKLDVQVREEEISGFFTGLRKQHFGNNLLKCACVRI